MKKQLIEKTPFLIYLAKFISRKLRPDGLIHIRSHQPQHDRLRTNVNPCHVGKMNSASQARSAEPMAFAS